MGLFSINKKDYFILIFQNETQVIAAESFVKKMKYETKIISIPRKVSSGCGMAIRLKISDKNNILKVLQDNNINYVKLLNMEEL